MHQGLQVRLVAQGQSAVWIMLADQQCAPCALDKFYALHEACGFSVRPIGNTAG